MRQYSQSPGDERDPVRDLARRLLPLASSPIFNTALDGATGRKKVPAMSQRESNLLWLKDMLEHMVQCQQQLEWAEDEEAVQVLTETMLRDLESCRRLLSETMHRRGQMAAV